MVPQSVVDDRSIQLCVRVVLLREQKKINKEMVKDSVKEVEPALPKKNVLLVPPDGGWGWMIILATCVNLVNKKKTFLKFYFVFV